MIDYVILHCIDFQDDGFMDILKPLINELDEREIKTNLFNLPNSYDENHWRSFALYDFSRYCKSLVCVGFPAGFARHNRSKIIFEFSTRELPSRFKEAVRIAEMESNVVLHLSPANKAESIQRCLEVLA